MDGCIFYKISKKEIKSNILFEDDLVLVILDINPIVDGHCLVIPKDHYENIYDSPEKVLQRINVVCKKIAKVLKEKLNCTGVNIVNASGKDAQQSVFHLHYHIIPRYNNDGLNLWFHGKNVNNDLTTVFEKLTQT